jgi:lipoprotein-anchoring transpeptidase ErfK/SrfK
MKLVACFFKPQAMERLRRYPVIGGMLLARLLVGLAIVLGSPVLANAESLVVRIDLSRQRMNVSVDGQNRYSWPVSTGRPGYSTPIGTFKPKRLERVWYSTKYESAPMPYSIFFYGGFAIHGTEDVRHLGRPVSHGCVRLHPKNARALYNMVRRYGMRSTLIRIQR